MCSSDLTLLVEMLLEENDPFKPEKKRQILIRLAEIVDLRIRDGIQDALRDFDEGIRYAAVEALLAQEHEALQTQWEQTQQRLSDHEAQQDRDAASLSKTRRELASVKTAKAKAIGDLEESLARLKPLPAMFKKSEGQAKQWREQFQALEGESGLEIEELRRQLAVIEPLPEELAECRDELQLTRDLLLETQDRARNSEERVAELLRVDSERAEELGTLREEFVTLERTSQETIHDQRGQLDELTDLPEKIKVREEQLRVNQARLENLTTSTDEELKILRARVDELSPYPALLAERDEEMSKMYGAKGEIAFGSQIRSYVLHPYQMVKDHRTKVEKGNVQAVLDGDLDEFIETYLRTKGARKG